MTKRNDTYNMTEQKEQKTRVFGKKQKLTAIALMALMGLAPSMLISGGSTIPMTEGFFWFAVYAAALFAGTTYISKLYDNGRIKEQLSQMKSEVMGIVESYNSQVTQLERDYYQETTSLKSMIGFGKDRLRMKYSNAYVEVKQDFDHQKEIYLEDHQQDMGQFRQLRSLWGWAFVIALSAMTVTCVSSIPADETPTASALSQTGETTFWNAENIPIPYLQDATQYVSNPDHVLSQPAVDHINMMMKQLEDSLDVQSVVIVVNHIENDDPYRMALDVGNRYGVGRKDRGLVIVVGYEDHSINMSPGRSLEADLTDAECYRLQQQYVVPSMKANQPDTAMIYLADAIYATLKGKELPQMSSLLSDADSDSDSNQAVSLYSCFLMLLVILYAYKNKTYQWIGGLAAMNIMANPFIDYDSSSGFSSGGGFSGRSGGFGGGGGFSGGSFGGGSFGGGGATSRW